VIASQSNPTINRCRTTHLLTDSTNSSTSRPGMNAHAKQRSLTRRLRRRDSAMHVGHPPKKIGHLLSHPAMKTPGGAGSLTCFSGSRESGLKAANAHDAPRSPARDPTGSTDDRWRCLAAIEVHELTKRYGSRIAAGGVTFAVRPGVVTGFVGPNGSEKSTTMRMIMELDAPRPAVRGSTGRRSSGRKVLSRHGPTPRRRRCAARRPGRNALRRPINGLGSPLWTRPASRRRSDLGAAALTSPGRPVMQ
jgi:ABC-type glutathione transport system ATPase component